MLSPGDYDSVPLMKDSPPPPWLTEQQWRELQTDLERHFDERTRDVLREYNRMLTAHAQPR